MDEIVHHDWQDLSIHSLLIEVQGLWVDSDVFGELFARPSFPMTSFSYWVLHCSYSAPAPLLPVDNYAIVRPKRQGEIWRKGIDRSAWVVYNTTMPRSREKRVKVWLSILPDDYLRLEILEERTLFPIRYHIEQAIKEYVKDVHPTTPGARRQ